MFSHPIGGMRNIYKKKGLTMNTTPEALIKEYADPIEQQEIDKFVCAEMGRQIHRYIKGMSGTKTAMLKFEERLASLTLPEKEKAIAKIGRAHV